MTVYLIRHSYTFGSPEGSPSFVNLENWQWEEFNKNMILSVEGEELARKLAELAELSNISAVYSANSARAIGTAKYVARKNILPINVVNEINERSYKSGYAVKDIMNNKGLYTETEKEVTSRFCNWFNKIIKNSKDEKIAVFLHAKILILYLKTLGYELKFTEDGYWIKKGDKIICDKKVIGNPLLVKLEFANGKFMNFENIALDFALTKHPLWW